MKLKAFAVWRAENQAELEAAKREMAGVATIVNPKKDCNNPDFQVQGAVCSKAKKSGKPN